MGKYDSLIEKYITQYPDLTYISIAKKIIDENDTESRSSETMRKKVAHFIKNRDKRLENSKDKKTIDISDDCASYEYQGRKSLKSLKEAIEFFDIDLKQWEVDRFITNSWDVTVKDGTTYTNYQVKVFLRKKQFNIDLPQAQKLLKNAIKKITIPKTFGNKHGMVMTADFHFGAYIDELLRSPDFSFNKAIEYLQTMAKIVNDKKLKHVHVALLGDFIESFSGLNHRNSWKGLEKGMFGMNSSILAFEILRDSFLSKINNLETVDIISGNHDRVTADRELDERGEVGYLLYYLFKMQYGNSLDITYHPMVINKIYDNISYVFTHGHLPFNKKEISKILFDYGKQGYFNVIAEAHWHTREIKKTTRRKQIEYKDVTVVEIDEADYRKITIPPLFTGNFYSESLGYSSSAGFCYIENNGKGKINYFDYCL